MKLIVIEGLDGSGKSTQIGMLNDWLENNGVLCRYLHFPRTGSPWFGELIARFLRGEFGTIDQVDPYLVAMLYAGDRKDAAEMIGKWLDDKYYVILDRYTYSNIAYQCAKLGSEQERSALRNWITELEFNHFGIPVPDINIFLDVPFLFTREKLKNSRDGGDRDYLKGNSDIHESSLDFQMKVREMYLEIAKTDPRLHIISCHREQVMFGPDEIFKLILNDLRTKGILS